VTNPHIGRRLAATLARLMPLLLAWLAACTSFEEMRMVQLMHESGFGTRASGDATLEEHVGGLDQIQFLFDREVLGPGSSERLIELTVAQPVGLDGTIHVPYVGPVYVLGLTEAELSALVQRQLNAVLAQPIDLQARIIISRKFFYTAGEVTQKGKIMLTPDMTFMDAMYEARWTNFANLGHVYLIRPDAETPLVLQVNFREMVTTGLVAANFRMREHDILYVPPTLLGVFGRLLQRVTEPIGLAVRTMFGIAQVRTAADVAAGRQDLYYFRY
jgi:hypothetical protein